MISLEKQVCSLELAKRLKELGVKQESLFYWSTAHPEKAKDESEREALEAAIPQIYSQKWEAGDGKLEDISAFTVAELGQMLPISIDDESRNYRLVFTCTTYWWYCGYEETKSGSWAWHSKIKGHVFKKGTTEADARAKMLIYLVENKLV